MRTELLLDTELRIKAAYDELKHVQGFKRLIINGKEINPRSILDSSQFISCWKKENASNEEMNSPKNRKKEWTDEDARIRKLDKDAGMIDIDGDLK